MTKKKIKEHIKDNRPWSVDKEWELIRILGGATQWGDDYYIKPAYYDNVVEAIDEAMNEISTKDYKESDAYKELKHNNVI